MFCFFFFKKETFTDIFEAPFDLIPDPLSSPSSPEVTSLLRLAQQGTVSIRLHVLFLMGLRSLRAGTIFELTLYPQGLAQKGSDMIGR